MKDPTPSRRLSGVDAAFLYLERQEIPLHIAGVCLFDGPIDFEELVASIDSKLHLIPRYRQVVVDPPFHIGYPTWEDAADFDIRRHIFRAHVEPPGGKPELEELAGRILSQLMDRAKPLWDIHVIEGMPEGQGAMIFRVHHALADGVSGASLMRIMLDPTPQGSRAGRKPRFQPRPVQRQDQSVTDALASALHSSLQNLINAEAVLLDMAHGLVDERTPGALQELMSLLPELAASCERFPFNKPCTGERKFCWTEFPLEDAQKIREKLGGTVNDVILTVVNLAMARYIRLHGEPVAGRFLRMICPVNVRQEDQQKTLGNQISFLPVVLPLGIRKPVEMLHAVSARTAIMKKSRAAHLVALMSSWLGAAPPPVQAWFWDAIPQITLPLPLFNMICTNVMGSPTPLYAAGRRMTACYPHVPTGYELGVNIAIQSYDGKLYYGFTADAHVVADAAKLRDFVQDAFRDLCRAAGVRRTPRRRTTTARDLVALDQSVARPHPVNGSPALPAH